MNIGILTLHIYLPGCKSLKEKRSYIKPLIHRVHREYNVSIAEIKLQDKWQESILSIVLVSNDRSHLNEYLCNVMGFIKTYYKNIELYSESIEII